VQLAHVLETTVENPPLAGRYGVIAGAADESGISTLHASDLETGEEVSITAVRISDVTAARRARLAHELLALRGLASPYLSPLNRIDDSDGLLLSISPRVPGSTLAERLRQGRLEVLDALSVVEAIALALQAIHERGLLHLDVEPENIILPSTSEAAAVLTYTGFTRSTRAAHSRELSITAAHFASPEEAGVLHRRVDERSDIYSAGCLLFACLCGKPPFVGDTVNDVLRAQLSGGVPSLREGCPDVPRVVEAVLTRMVATEPHNRYSSAAAAASDLREIIDALNRGEQPEYLTRRASKSRRSLTEPELVGRQAELAVLHEKLELARAGVGSLVTIEAESGGGKTRLLEELISTCAKEPVWLLQGQGRNRSAQSPYQVLEGVIDAVARRMESDEPFAERLRGRLRDQAEALATAMPQLASRLGAGGNETQNGSSRQRVASMQGLKTLLDLLGTCDHPALVILDDCQWADEATVELLFEWQGAQDGEERHVLIVAAMRSEDPGAAAGLLEVADQRLSLPRMRESEIERLVESMAGSVPGEVIDTVTQVSGGSPFVATEVLRGLVETDLLTADDEGWHVEADRMAEAQSTARGATIVGERIGQLPEEVLEILSAAAIIGKQFTVAEVTELTDYPLSATLAALAEARRRHILWFDFDGGHWAFLHDQLRDMLHARLGEATQRELHLRVAKRLKDESPEGVFDLAYHFHAAHEPAQALPYAMAAASQARSRYALEIAERHYYIALEAVGDGDARTRRAVNEGLGEVALLRGHYEEANRHFAAALEFSQANAERAEIEGKLGELAFKRGDVKDAIPRIERALRLLGERVPRRRLTFVMALLHQIIVQFAHTVLPGRFLGRCSLSHPRASRDLLAARLYSELAHAYWFGAGRVPCGWTHLRGMNLAERYAPTPELAQAYSEHAPVNTMIPWFSRGIAYAKRSLEIRRELGDKWGEGQSMSFCGTVLYSAGRFTEALSNLRAAVEILERTGDKWEVSLAKWHVTACLYRLGRLTEAVETAQEVHRAAVELGDIQAAGIALGFWAKAAAGEVPHEYVREALSRDSGDVHTAAEVLQAEALSRLAAGDPMGAVAALESANARVREARLRQEYIAPVSAWLATALRAALSRETPLAPKRRAELAKRARRAARRAHRIARSYPNNLPHALREKGMLAACFGHPRRARRLLDRSLMLAERQGAAAEYAETLAARGAVGVALGWEEGDDQLAQAIRMTGAILPNSAAGHREQTTLSLADRFDRVLEAGRSIAAALTEDAVFAAVADATETLLRVHSFTVFAVGGAEGDLRVHAMAGEHDEDGARQELALKALADGHRVVTFEDLPADAEEDPRSALCAIIYVRGVAQACVCATYSGVGDLFEDEEQRLAAYIASLAGAALENAQGFAASEALSRSLERRVEERTAELSASTEKMEVALSLLAATLDSTADGILVVDTEGRIISHNAKFSELWRVPPRVMDSQDGRRVLGHMMKQLTDADEFVAAIRDLYADDEVESTDVIEFKDGRVYEQVTKPQVVAGKTVGRVWSFRDITSQKRSEQELEHLANHDGLTGLLNRRCFEQELTHSIAQIRRYGGTAAALILDVDNFKYVNDTLGHGAGDELIKSVARLLTRRLRATDVIARMGGDEFAVLLRETDAATAQRVATDLLGEVRHHAVAIGGQRVSMTASIGVALLEDAATDASQLLADADLAMYEAKRAGRDGVSVYSTERAREARVKARYTWAERLRWALEKDRFELFAQPILHLASGKTTRHEVLLRMPGEDGEMLSPAAFMPSAERLGLILAIDRWVVSRAIRELATWDERHSKHALEINLSGTSLGDAELPALIARELEAASIDPSRLIFEVTETATIANMDDAKNFAGALTDLGCKFALDDFGTGFGSFYYLKHLPVDYLKIDGDFISDLPQSATDQLVVKTIVEIAKGTGKKTIAEFVTNPEVLRFVEKLGIDFAQGYFIGRPEPISQIQLG
jgi:diguanylate cyclase (GGDEF)-like protein